MGRWNRLSPEEVERRRLLSVSAMAARDREEFDRRYQERCDRLYWTRGQCCAGCDHWLSNGGDTGECSAAGIVSGVEVLRSLGIHWCTYTPPPGLPYSKADFHCGKFRDDFDWSALDHDYLSRIGAIRNGVLRSRPPARERGG